jgi:hypothetical protein
VYAAGEDTLRISAEKMEYFRQFSKLVATFDVKSATPDYNTTSDFLIFNNRENKAVFSGNPRFYSSFGDARAVNFYLYFKDRQLEKAELQDSCLVNFSEEEGKPAGNWCKADFIHIDFVDKQIRKFLAESNVSYYYEQQEAPKKDYMQNMATGATLQVVFKPDNKVQYMKMQQKIQGKYKFKNKQS